MNLTYINTPLVTLEAWLAEALTSKHAIAVGQRVVSVMYRDRRTQFTESTIIELTSYINELRDAIAYKIGATSRHPFSVAKWTR